MKRAAIYARVSTDEQAERGYSIQHQIDECKRYAELHGLSVVNVITDDISGMTLERPGFIALRSKLMNGEANAVVVYTVDRLARDAVDFLSLRRQWERMSIDLHFVDRGQSQGDFSGLLMDGMFALMAEGEAWTIRKRTSEGRHNKAKSGKPVLSGHPPYAYKHIGSGADAKYVINKKDSQVVRDIFDWYIHGNGNGMPMSLRAIAKELEERGVPPTRHKKKIAKFWYANTVRGILTNPIYKGVTYYGKLKTVTLPDGTKKRVQRPRSEWTEIQVPELAIVDAALFDAVQKRAEKNKRLAKRNRKRKYLLSGHIRCGSCGYSVVGKARTDAGKESTHYQCGRYFHPHPKNACSQIIRSVNNKKIEKPIWDWLLWLLSDDRNLDDGLKKLLAQREQGLEPKKERVNIVTEMIDETDARIARLVVEMSNHEPGIVLDAIRNELNSVEKQRIALQTDLDKLLVQIADIEISDSTLYEIKANAARVRKRLPKASFDDKRLILDLLDVEIKLYFEDKKIWLDVACSILPNPHKSNAVPLRPEVQANKLIVERPS